MKLAIGYIRVSSKGQRDEGLSPDAQEKIIREWAEKNGYVMYEPIFSDNGKSGGKLSNRPGAQAAIELACKEHAVLVTWKLSRTFRSIKDAINTLEKLHKHKADIVSISEQFDTTTAMGEGMFAVVAIFDQISRKITGENTKMILADLKAQGKRMGSVDYGWMPDMSRPEKKIKRGVERTIYPYLIECPEEQENCKEMRRLRDAGYSAQSIATIFDHRGRKPRNGGKWGLTQIKRILKKGA